MDNNAEIKSSIAEAKSASAMVSSAYTPDDPMVGLSRLERGMETTYLTITQKFRFPTKYYVQGKSGKKKSLAKQAMHDWTVLAVRQKVIDAYFELYKIQKSIEYSEENLQSVKEVARVAEKKYSSGSGIQADSMRSHVEITKLEIELINLRQEEEAAREQLAELVNSDSLNFSSLEISSVKRPILKADNLRLLKEQVNSSNVESSKLITAKKHELEAAEWESSLAKWEFAPDIQLQYQHAIGGMPEDSRIYGIGLNIPLFFWSKSSKASAASQNKIAKRYQLIDAQRKTKARVVDLLGKVEAGEKTLRIYDTSLIPQAKSTYNSSLASYRAGKLSLTGLLDSERSLYQVRLSYLKTLQLYVKNISLLERESGIIVSDL